jgi:uncharacterized membrane protein YphA (DoxX/SURF4 family)
MMLVGNSLFAFGLAGVGVLSLGSGDFPYTWQPVPEWTIWRKYLAFASGLLLLGLGIGMVLKRSARTSSLFMTTYVALWVVLLQSPHVIQAPVNVGAWLGFCENLVLTCGGWIIFLSLDGVQHNFRLKFLADPRLPRFLFGLCCIVFGISHFVYVAATAAMVPSWLPHRTFFAYLTGAGHFSAGLAIVCRVTPRVAAILEASMISCFVLLLHIPGVLSSPGSRLQWTMLCVASSLAGAAWTIADDSQKNSAGD